MSDGSVESSSPGDDEIVGVLRLEARPRRECHRVAGSDAEVFRQGSPEDDGPGLPVEPGAAHMFRQLEDGRVADGVHRDRKHRDGIHTVGELSDEARALGDGGYTCRPRRTAASRAFRV